MYIYVETYKKIFLLLIDFSAYPIIVIESRINGQLHSNGCFICSQ